MSLRYAGLVQTLFIFDVEIVIFAALNIWQPVTNHWLLASSYVISIAYLLLMILVVPFVFMVANKPPELLSDPEYSANFECVYEGFKLDDGISKYFRAFDVVRFIFFGLVLVFMYYVPLVQISGSLVIAVAYTTLLYIFKPHTERKAYIIDLITHGLFISANFCFLILAVDDAYDLYPIELRVLVGWAIFAILIVALSVSIYTASFEIKELAIKIVEYCRKKKPEEDLTDSASENQSKDIKKTPSK